jgi:hypothetical protein
MNKKFQVYFTHAVTGSDLTAIRCLFLNTVKNKKFSIIYTKMEDVLIKSCLIEGLKSGDKEYLKGLINGYTRIENVFMEDFDY